ncbi:hypothetical protein BDZ97DRAFT_1920864 [Flammula alnicola]|nr:hypothetical protein BDZ97DRAFT_1920864 [Flammula alnicola]
MLIETAKKPQAIPSPLPIAAAHHPAHLKRLRRPVFQSKPKAPAGDDSVPPVPSRSHAKIILAGHLDSEKHMRQTLADALARELMASLGFEREFDILQSDGVDDDEALERKLEDIRGSILPAYPSIPDLSGP